MNAITRPTTYATAAVTTLRDAITGAHATLRDAVCAYREAHTVLSAEPDLSVGMRAAAEIVLSAEALTAAAKHIEATARAALATCMSEVGCPAISLDHHVIHLGTKPDRVDIEDEQVIPTELMRQPPPAPDKVAIGKRLRAGQEVPGARLIGNHEPTVVFRSRPQ